MKEHTHTRLFRRDTVVEGCFPSTTKRFYKNRKRSQK